jgi:HTH-type transcriptional regulator / antitoxin HipB
MRLTAKKLGELVKTARQRMGVTQRALALTSGTGLRFIVDLEKGKPTCQLGKALAVVNTLGVEIALKLPPADKATERDTTGE